MSRGTSINYSSPSFPIASADTDQFDAADVQQLATALDTHNHTAGKGLTTGGGGGGLTVREVDLLPSVAATTLEFPNSTLTDQGGGVVRYTPAAGGGGTTVLLDNSISTNVSLAISSGSWTDFYTFPTFTPTVSGVPIFAEVNGNLRVDLATIAVCTSRLILDPAGAATPFPLGGEQDNGGRNNALAGGAGGIYLGSALSLSAHTLKLQVMINGSSGTMHVNKVSSPDNEFLHVLVTQEGGGAGGGGGGGSVSPGLNVYLANTFS